MVLIQLLILFLVPAFGQSNLVVKSVPKLKVKAPVYSRDFFSVDVGYVWWQETAQLSNTTGGNYGLIANTNGVCLGGGWRQIHRHFDLTLDGCGLFAFTDVSIVNSPPLYFQQSVTTYGLIVGPGIHYKPSSKFVTIGLDAPLMARYTNWTLPSPNYTVTPQLRYTGGLMLEGAWRLNRLFIREKIGPMYNMSWLWQMDLQYVF